MNNMPQIGIGSVVKTATVSIGDGSLELEYKPPRGRRFLTVIVGDVDAKGDGSEIDVEKVFNEMGWYRKEDIESNLK